jgi:hypothetical protein
MCCFKRLVAESPDDDIVRFVSGYDRFNLRGAYYAMKCLMYAKAAVRRQDGTLKRSYKGGLLEEICAIPSTPHVNHFKYGIYGMYVSIIFSSPLCDALKRIELGVAEINQGAINSAIAFLKKNVYYHKIPIAVLLEILAAIGNKGHVVSATNHQNQLIRAVLKHCITRKDYVAKPITTSVTLESTYAGHRVAQCLGIQGPSGVSAFIDSLQNENGGFGCSESSGIAILGNRCLAVSAYGSKVS